MSSKSGRGLDLKTAKIHSIFVWMYKGVGVRGGYAGDFGKIIDIHENSGQNLSEATKLRKSEIRIFRISRDFCCFCPPLCYGRLWMVYACTPLSMMYAWPQIWANEGDYTAQNWKKVFFSYKNWIFGLSELFGAVCACMCVHAFMCLCDVICV